MKLLTINSNTVSAVLMIARHAGALKRTNRVGAKLCATVIKLTFVSVDAFDTIRTLTRRTVTFGALRRWFAPVRALHPVATQ